MPAVKLDQNSYRTVWINLFLAVSKEVTKLAWGRIIKGQNDGLGTAREHNLSVDIFSQTDWAITFLVKLLQIFPKAFDRSSPPTLLLLDQVIFQNHHFAEFIRQGRRHGRSLLCMDRI